MISLDLWCLVMSDTTWAEGEKGRQGFYTHAYHSVGSSWSSPSVEAHSSCQAALSKPTRVSANGLSLYAVKSKGHKIYLLMIVLGYHTLSLVFVNPEHIHMNSPFTNLFSNYSLWACHKFLAGALEDKKKKKLNNKCCNLWLFTWKSRINDRKPLLRKSFLILASVIETAEVSIIMTFAGLKQSNSLLKPLSRIKIDVLVR